MKGPEETKAGSPGAVRKGRCRSKSHPNSHELKIERPNLFDWTYKLLIIGS
jgi:hypothetical protein